jgi:SAM-dependent methyltransferase
MDTPKSITYVHLLSILSSEIARAIRVRPDSTFRLLEVGCGRGDLAAYLARHLPRMVPGLDLEYYAYDVYDYLSHDTGDANRLVEYLREQCPGYPWEQRISYIATDEPWPYPDEFFDAIISKQVLEHVADHDAMFAEIARTLRDGAFSVHLLPLKHHLVEGHVNMPLVHWLKDHDRLSGYIRLMSRLGVGKFRKQAGLSLEAFSEKYADYLHHHTHYLSATDVMRLGKKHRLRVSFRYTKEFYFAKLRSLMGRPPRQAYAPTRWWLTEALWFAFLKYVSGVTVFLEKKNVRMTRQPSREREYSVAGHP